MKHNATLSCVHQNHTSLSVTNYDSTLIGWARQNVQSGVSLGAGGLYYCTGESARQTLIDNGWKISGDAKECNILNSISDDSENLMEVFPNPFSSSISVTSNMTIQRVEIFSLSGKRLADWEADFDHLSVHNLKEGAYLLRIMTPDDFIIKRIIKQ